MAQNFQAVLRGASLDAQFDDFVVARMLEKYGKRFDGEMLEDLMTTEMEKNGEFLGVKLTTYEPGALLKKVGDLIKEVEYWYADVEAGQLAKRQLANLAIGLIILFDRADWDLALYRWIYAHPALTIPSRQEIVDLLTRDDAIERAKGFGHSWAHMMEQTAEHNELPWSHAAYAVITRENIEGAEKYIYYILYRVGEDFLFRWSDGNERYRIGRRG